MPGDRSRWAESKKRLFCIGYPDLPRVIRRHLTPQKSLVSRDFLRKWAACRKAVFSKQSEKCWLVSNQSDQCRAVSSGRRSLCCEKQTGFGGRFAFNPFGVARSAIWGTASPAGGLRGIDLTQRMSDFSGEKRSAAGFQNLPCVLGRCPAPNFARVQFARCVKLFRVLGLLERLQRYGVIF